MSIILTSNSNTFPPPAKNLVVVILKSTNYHQLQERPIHLLYYNFLCINRFRQYGLWERYAELYPDNDLVYTIGASDYTKHWFYAQVNR